MNYNYHTHTYRCKHAKGTDEAYVKAAIKNGFEVLGFTDHCAWRFENKRYRSGMRMSERQIAGYVKSVRRLQEKYKDKIDIRLGFEVEYLEKYWDWMKETLDKYQFDYIIVGHHFSGDEIGGTYSGNLTTVEQINNYADDICKAMDSGIVAYIAHPDIFMKGYQKWDEHSEAVARRIIEKSMETGVPIEYNLLGLEHARNDKRVGYPNPKFWRLAGQMGATALVGVDAHRPWHLGKTALRERSLRLLKMYGLNLTEEIKYLR